jgi:predicted Rossmann fold flavoprotein
LRFAEAAGHRIAPPRPALVGIETEPVCAGAQGLNLRNVRMTLWVDGKKQASEFGEAECTDTGFDGPIVLKLSRQIVDFMAAGRKVEVTLDLKPALDAPKLEARLLRSFQAGAGGTCGDFLRSLLPPQLIGALALRLGLDPSAPLAQLTVPRRNKLAGLLKELRFDVRGHGSWDTAIVTAGGVSLKDIDPRTMGSRKVGQLYFAGEVVDLDANTGGYNLQIAFSTGWLAGESAARAAVGQHA